MPQRRVSARGGSQAPSSQRGTSDRVRRITRNHQAPHRSGHIVDLETIQLEREEIQEPESASDQVLPSKYSQSTQADIELMPATIANQSDAYTQSATMEPISRPASSQQLTSGSQVSISLQDMRQLLRTHEQDIVDCVFLQLQSEDHNPRPATAYVKPTIVLSHQQGQQAESASRVNRIADLEAEHVQHQAERQLPYQGGPLPGDSGMYDPILPLSVEAHESTSGIVKSVEILFPGVEWSTLVQIIENCFKPKNIYWLLATEKNRVEAQRTINIGGIEFEQSKWDGKECEYRMGNFFKAWAAYSGILVKLAPYSLQGKLGISLFIYTMTLYDLLEKYTWEGVRSYHFQYHGKPVASGKFIYLSQDWRQIDSELIASKCFAYTLLRTTWSTSITRPTSFPGGNMELPLREPPFPQGFSNHRMTPSQYRNIPERC